MWGGLAMLSSVWLAQVGNMDELHLVQVSLLLDHGVRLSIKPRWLTCVCSVIKQRIALTTLPSRAVQCGAAVEAAVGPGEQGIR